MIAVTSPPNAALKDGTPKESSKPIDRIISATWDLIMIIFIVITAAKCYTRS